MANVEDILSNPGSSWFYLNQRYYYAIGNTKSVDLTEGFEVPADAQFLLLGCGDIRNILQTVQDVNQIKPLPKSLTFHINDIDAVLLARNAVLIQIIKSVEPDNRDDVNFVWNVWYNLSLSEQHSQRLKSVMSDMLENPLDCLQFASTECSSAVKRVIKYWLKKKISVNEILRQREYFICQKMQADFNSDSEISFSRSVSTLSLNSGIYSGLTQRKPNDDVETYFRTGSTNAPSPACVNPSLLCPYIDGWRVHHGSLPFKAYNEQTFNKTLSLTENCINQLQTQLRNWNRYRVKGGTVKVVIWHGDAFTLCNRRMPDSMKFHFINTSNLCDHITILDVLLAGSKRLERFGVLTIQIMSLSKRNYSSVEEYFDAELGIPTSFYPTFLGLHLVDDFELGTSKVPNLAVDVTTRWLASRDCSPLIDLKESPDITDAFRRIVSSCFESCLLAPSKLVNTPLTLVYVMQELSSKLTESIIPLLKIVERCLPSMVTLRGETFSPLALEWKALTLFYFGEDLHQQPPDALVTVQIPATANLSAAPRKASPAGMDVIHRAIVTKGMESIMALTKGRTIEPWSTLTIIDYDYKTSLMTCVLPKSEVDNFCTDTTIWPFYYEGQMSPLLPTGPFHICAPYILNPRRADAIEQAQDTKAEDNSSLNLIVTESRQGYKIILRPSKLDVTLKSFKTIVDQTTMRAIKFQFNTSKTPADILSELEITLSCPVEMPATKTFRMTNVLNLSKFPISLRCPTILPLRRMDVSLQPLYPAVRKEELFEIVGAMFSSIADRKSKASRSESFDTLYNVKETVQIILNWSVDPPKDKPLVRAYRLLRGDPSERSKVFQFGFYPEDIFIGVRKLHSVNGLPTLDLVWMDLEIFRKQVPYKYGIETREGEEFLLENGGSVRTPDTWHCFFITVQEARLLKRLLRINTRSSVQKLNKYGSLGWCFNSFLQPVFSTAAGKDYQDILRKSCTSEGLNEMLKMRQQMLQNIDSAYRNPMLPSRILTACEFCGSVNSDLKKCSRCKCVSYCNSNCQQKDWENTHRMICRKIKSLKKGKEACAKTLQKDVKHACSYCSVFAEDVKACSKCRAVFYCSKICQENDWVNHKNACAAEKLKPVSPHSSLGQSYPGQSQNDGQRKSEMNNQVNLENPGLNKNISTQTSVHTDVSAPQTQLNVSPDIGDLPKKCTYCEKTGNDMKKCSRCKAVFYCSRTCQKLDWRIGHSKVCFLVSK